MKAAHILHHGAAVTRVGIQKETTEVIFSNDFSVFALMLEEYISTGVVEVNVSASSPEGKLVKTLPRLLRERVKVIDDSREIDTVARLLYGLRKDFGAGFDEETGHPKFSADTPREVCRLISDVHIDLHRLALGFNRGLQVDVQVDAANIRLEKLRECSCDDNGRAVLAQLQGLLACYEQVGFDAVAPEGSEAGRLVMAFDTLVNDRSYLEYSDAITRLYGPSTRRNAISELRHTARKLAGAKWLGLGWNLLTRGITAWSGVPLPESSELTSLLGERRALPPLVDLFPARQKAVEAWKRRGVMDPPLTPHNLDQAQYDWLPVLPSLEAGRDGFITLGTVGELKNALEAYERSRESDREVS